MFLIRCMMIFAILCLQSAWWWVCDQIVCVVLSAFSDVVFTSAVSTPWYNRHGWLGVKNQLSISIYLQSALFITSLCFMFVVNFIISLCFDACSLLFYDGFVFSVCRFVWYVCILPAVWWDFVLYFVVFCFTSRSPNQTNVKDTFTKCRCNTRICWNWSHICVSFGFRTYLEHVVITKCSYLFFQDNVTVSLKTRPLF